MVNDDRLLVKLNGLGMSDEGIAARIGWDVALVKARWEGIMAQAAAADASGHNALIQQFNLLCSQYQLLGENLKILALAFSHQVSSVDIQTIVDNDPANAGLALSCAYIVLDSFKAVSPEESFKNSLKSN